MNNDDFIFIDPTHSKQTILGIIKQSNINISQPYILTKDNLFEALKIELAHMNYNLEFYNPTFPFKNKEEFIIFLGQSKEKLSYYETQQISFIAKQIISFVKSGYDYSKSPFKEYDEVERAVLKIKEYGDIFCVRTAVKYFNLTRDYDKQIECKVSPFISSQIQLKNLWKKNSVPTLQIKTGKFKIDFT
tara:strand:- start:753 stop:1319 length:567 start_codon:yes stop_codon:yes gene_type:complete